MPLEGGWRQVVLFFAKTYNTVTDQSLFKSMRIFCLVLVLVGALTSLGVMLYVGRRNASVLLVSLFFAWVLSPFVGLLIADRISVRWTQHLRQALCWIMLLVTGGSVLSYFGALGLARAKPAGIFLLVPLVSLLILGIFVWVAARLSRGQSSGSKSGTLSGPD